MNLHLTLSAYLCAFLFWLELSLGLMGILMIGRLTGGRWLKFGEPILVRTLPSLEILALLFLPVAFGLQYIYPWAAAANVTHEATLRLDFFLNPVWFRARAFTYWVLWISFARLLRSSVGQRPLLSGLGLLMMLFTCSFAAMDWIMTLEPTWSSTGFGVTFIASALISAFSFLTFMVVSHDERTAPMRDYGNLLLMAVLFWIYVEFLEYLIIWSGQIPDEMHWYRVRSVGIYAILLGLITLIGFAIPSIALLFERIKQNPVLLVVIALTLWLMRWPETFWLVFPDQAVDPLRSGLITIFLSLMLGFAWFISYRRSTS